MNTHFDRLKAILVQVHDLWAVAQLMDWDQETRMPPGGAVARGQHMSTIHSVAHALYTSDEVGALLETLQPFEAGLDPASDEASIIRVTRREYTSQRRISAELVSEMSLASAAGRNAWLKARAEKDFAQFQPFLARNLELSRAFAACFDDVEQPYDALLRRGEPGITTAEVQALFDEVRPVLTSLSAQIAAKPDTVDDSPLHQYFDPDAQLVFGSELARGLGYDFERGRVDLAPHPFMLAFSVGDVRITTRLKPEFPPACWFSMMHEAGHALFEQNISPTLERTTLASVEDIVSASIHESQSRLYENVVGRSRPFWEHFYPLAQQHFPTQLGDVSLDAFYRAFNKSAPSFIRVEADEVTYGQHIILRFELEVALVSGALDVADVPGAWNDRMQELLGITPPDDALGCLQDIHWSSAMMGYFPTYLLGSIFASQLMVSMRTAVPDVDAQMARGEFGGLNGWLAENVHQHGRKFTLQELAQRATGQPLVAGPYIAYLKAKFGDIYGL